MAAAVGRAHVADAGAGREGAIPAREVVGAASMELQEHEAAGLEDRGPARPPAATMCRIGVRRRRGAGTRAKIGQLG